VAARKQAKDLRREIDEGIDPLNQRENAREAPRVSDITKRYLEEHTPHLTARNAADQHSIMGKLVEPDWGSRLVTEITKANVEKLLTKIAAGRARPSKAKPNNRAHKLQGVKPTPVRANWVGEVLRKMFTLAIGWGWREDNPASAFRRRIENEREWFLTLEEIGRLAKVLDATNDQRAAGIIRLCMLTSARSGEVRQARFEQFNLDLGSWSKPTPTTKQRKIHRIPISGDVAAIVRQRGILVPKGNPWLFPGDTPDQPVKEIRRFWVAIQKEAQLPEVRIHDQRHTFASLLVSGRASLKMIGKLLGHTQIHDPRTYKRQATRYILGFEKGFPQEPTPETGDGSCGAKEERDAEPPPDFGHGAISGLSTNPSPDFAQSHPPNPETNLVREPLIRGLYT